jgi:hypothetical protein
MLKCLRLGAGAEILDKICFGREGSKERGHKWTYYGYPTVFIRSGANLAQLLLKTIKIDNRS